MRSAEKASQGEKQLTGVAAEEVQGVLVELYWPDEAACSLLLCLRQLSWPDGLMSSKCIVNC